jgi:hypothetical protein
MEIIMLLLFASTGAMATPPPDPLKLPSPLVFKPPNSTGDAERGGANGTRAVFSVFPPLATLLLISNSLS